MVSAFAARQRLVLGQVKVADKSNEIIAIPALPDMLAIEGAVVTINAMGCQREGRFGLSEQPSSRFAYARTTGFAGYLS
jgi:predicted transposase YbfD/YdcC